MSKKKTVVDSMIDDVKRSASTIGEAVGITEPKLYERIVAIPQVDIYSELPFELVEKNGKRVAAPAKAAKPASKPKKTAVALSKPASKTRATKSKKKKANKAH